MKLREYKVETGYGQFVVTAVFGKWRESVAWTGNISAKQEKRIRALVAQANAALAKAKERSKA